MCGDLVSRKGVSQSRVTFAVTGYVPDKALRELEPSRTGKIYVRVERGSDEVVMRVDHAGP
jgi:GTPase